MNSLQIKKALPFPSFKGVYPIDRLPKTKFDFPALFVVNYDAHDRPGTHWVAVSFDRLGIAEHFDSYGLAPLSYELLNFLDEHSHWWTHNTQRLQTVTSSLCGQYCCLYTAHKAMDSPMSSFIKLFSRNNFCANDRLVIKMFRDTLGACAACDEEEKNVQICIPQIDILSKHHN